MIERVRTFIGYREHPKNGTVSRYFVYKRALLAEAERLVLAQVLRDRDDIFYSTFGELHDVVRTNHVEDHLIGLRKYVFRSYRALTPPRVLSRTARSWSGRTDVPTSVRRVIGLPVSAGTIQGRARVFWTWPKPTSKRATSWSPPTPTPAGHPCSLHRGPGDPGGGLMTNGP